MSCHSDGVMNESIEKRISLRLVDQCIEKSLTKEKFMSVISFFIDRGIYTECSPPSHSAIRPRTHH